MRKRGILTNNDDIDAKEHELPSKTFGQSLKSVLRSGIRANKRRGKFPANG
jgi:hypothetical protein